MSKVAEELEFGHNEIYRDRYHVALKALLVMVVVAVVFTLAVALETVIVKKRQYFATTTSGVIVPMHALSEPVVTTPYLLQWASLATRTAFNLDFVHYSDQIEQSAGYFTPNGFNSYKAALKNSGLLDDITSKHLNMSMIVSGAPVVLNRYKESGRYTWEVQLPLLVTFNSASATEHEHMIATLKIQRVPVLTAEKGIQIADMSVR